MTPDMPRLPHSMKAPTHSEAAYNAANAAASQPSAGMSSAEMNNLTISDNLAELAAMSQSELLEKPVRE